MHLPFKFMILCSEICVQYLSHDVANTHSVIIGICVLCFRMSFEMIHQRFLFIFNPLYTSTMYAGALWFSHFCG